MTEQNATIGETLRRYSLFVRVLLICFLPALVIHTIVGCFLSGKQKEFWEKHMLGVSTGVTVLMAMAVVMAFVPRNTDSIMTEDTSNSSDRVLQLELDEKSKSGEDDENEKVVAEELARKVEEEEKARLVEEERAKKVAEEAEKQRQKEVALREQMSRAPAAFADPIGHYGEIIAVTGSIIVDYAYKPNDTHKYTNKLPVGAEGWGGFWIDTQYGKCYAMYWGYSGPQKEYHTGDTVTFVGKVISDESTYEPMSGFYAPLWLDAAEDF